MPSRYWPTALGLLAAAVLGWYLVYSQLLLRELQRDALVHYQLYSEIFSALNDPSVEAANEALLVLSKEIQTLDFPIIITDPDGGSRRGAARSDRAGDGRADRWDPPRTAGC